MFEIVRGDEDGELPVRPRFPWPHREMRVGDWFEVPVGVVRLHVLYNANYRWGRRLNARFAARTQKSGAIRVWRVA